MLPRTQRQKEVLDYITRFLAKHGHEPSYAQIARYFGVSSKATIAKHITALEKRGLIKRDHQPGRFTLAVKVEEVAPDAVCEVALLGRIAAGVPIDAIEDIEMICVPRFLFGRVRPERTHQRPDPDDDYLRADLRGAAGLSLRIRSTRSARVNLRARALFMRERIGFR